MVWKARGNKKVRPEASSSSGCSVSIQTQILLLSVSILLVFIVRFVVDSDSIHKKYLPSSSYTYRNATNTATATATVAADVSCRNQHDPTNYLYAPGDTNYTWLGNTWIPPPNVRRFRASEITELFRSENTLYIGDSTGRQDYQTWYNIMNAMHSDNILVRELEQNLNKNKQIPWHSSANFDNKHCPGRSLPPSGRILLDLLDMAQVKGTDADCHLPSTNSSSSFGKFDHGRVRYFHGLITRFEKGFGEAVQRDYSVLILTMGIWEIVDGLSSLHVPNSNATHKMVEVLDRLHRISGPSLFVIWKTNGPSTGEYGDGAVRTHSYITTARQWFEKQQPTYMDILDFGGEVLYGGRSLDNRIKGDTHAHYGLEARTLSLQMATDIVNRKSQRRIQEAMR
mmetsp:Transcript_16641/g.18337  ORF Transcript_16641/g.18337 Transcript_16641/m.18337 type:complete len:397 (+) Transcript_16641:42-1232(+)